MSEKRHADEDISMVIDLTPMRGADFGAAVADARRTRMFKFAAIGAIGPILGCLLGVLIGSTGGADKSNRPAAAAPPEVVESAVPVVEPDAGASLSATEVDASLKQGENPERDDPPSLKPLRAHPKSSIQQTADPLPATLSDALEPEESVDPEIAAAISEAIDEAKLNAKQRVEVPPRLPKRPARHAIIEAMKPATQSVRKCFNRFRVPGLVDLRFRIMPDGAMADVEIKGRFAGTPTAACVTRATAGTHFPRFSGPPMAIQFPFLLQ